jgi:hypothetical protein
MSCWSDKTYTAVVGWNRETWEYDGYLAGMPWLVGRAKEIGDLVVTLRDELQRWLDANGGVPFGVEVQVQPVRIDR